MEGELEVADPGAQRRQDGGIGSKVNLPRVPDEDGSVLYYDVARVDEAGDDEWYENFEAASGIPSVAWLLSLGEFDQQEGQNNSQSQHNPNGVPFPKLLKVSFLVLLLLPVSLFGLPFRFLLGCWSSRRRLVVAWASAMIALCFRLITFTARFERIFRFRWAGFRHGV